MKSTTQQITTARAFPMSIIKQAIACCWTEELNVVPVLWSPPGWTKSATVKSLANELGYDLWDLRLSDKDATDLGGIPSPQDKEFNGTIQRVVEYLANARLPWAHLYGDDYKCILFLDEVDRTSREVLNVSIQLLLDRGVNGFKLPKNCRVIAAGNGSSDTDTTRLNGAVVARLCHFYVDTKGPSALDHWIDWAQRSGEVSDALVGYARFRPEVFGGPRHEYVEQQDANPRIFTWADKALTLCDTIPGLSEDVPDSILFGLVGQVAGLEFQAFRTTLQNCPTFDRVVKDPDTAALPPADQVGVLYALGEAFLVRLYDPEGKKNLSPEVNPEHTRQVARYFRRCVKEIPTCREACAWWFRLAGEKLPSLCGLDEYKFIVR
jgi:hypothetical protein